MPKIIDPDNLIRNTSVIFDITSPSLRTIRVVDSAGNIASLVPPLGSGSDSGVSFQALYSFCKEQWKTQDDLIRIPFPFISITKTQFELLNNWNFFDAATRYLIRDGGWAIKTGSANDLTYEEWIGIVTLGSLGSTDQVYLQQSSSNEAAANFQMQGTVNQAIQTYFSGTFGVPATAYNKRGYTKLFVREWAKSYAQASIQSDLSVATEETTVYSIPLTNGTDLKITEAVSASANGAPYTELSTKFYSGSGFTARLATTTYAKNQVVSMSNGRWYINSGSTGASSASTNFADIVPKDGAAGVYWVTYPAERLIGTSYYPFNKIINAGVGKNLTIAKIYTRVQYLLRLNSDIDDSTDLSGSIGKITDPLLRFVGDTLLTYNGVYVDNFQDADTNSIDFYDVSGSVRRFPYVATGIIAFNENLIADLKAKYYMFFTSVPSGAFGSGSAVSVKDNTSIVISGSVSGSSSVAFTFDYDNNAQGGRTANSDAPVTVVAVGLSSAQYVKATATIARSKANNISLVSALERNYSNP